MEVNKWLNEIGYTNNDDLFGQCWFTDHNDSYITNVGMESIVQYIADKNVTQNVSHSTGFDPITNTWYGYHDDKIQGFKIGSVCKEGDIHYKFNTLDQQKIDAINLYKEEEYSYIENVRCIGVTPNDINNNKHMIIKWDYSKEYKIPHLRGKTSFVEVMVKPIGRGEWIAKSLEDAEQMANDYADGLLSC